MASTPVILTNAAAETTCPCVIMTVDKELYDPGESIRVTLDVAGTTNTDDVQLLFQVYDEAVASTEVEERRTYEGEPIEITYTPQDGGSGWHNLYAYVTVNGYTADVQHVIVYSTSTQDQIHITDFTLNKNNVRPGEQINFTANVTGERTALQPTYSYVIFCEKETDICTDSFSGFVEEPGMLVGQGEVPLSLQGDYLLNVWIVPPLETDYRPAKYTTEIRVEGEPVEKWSCRFESPKLCFDVNYMQALSEQQPPGATYSMPVMIDPAGELQVKIYNQTAHLLYEEVLQADSYGLVEFQYLIPEDSAPGYYFVNFMIQNDEGRIYSPHSLMYHIGGSSDSGAPVTIGETLFLYKAIDQQGVIEVTGGLMYVQGNPISITIGTHTPPPEYAVLPEQEVKIQMTDPEGSVIEDTSMKSDTQGDLIYSFTPTSKGRYKLLLTTEYGGIRDILPIRIPVGMESTYTISAEGKTFPVVFEDVWYQSTSIKNVEFNQGEKRLSVEIDQTEISAYLAVRIPYELLDGIQVFADGVPLKVDVTKDMDSAVFRLIVDDSVKKIDFIGTSAIPEFGSLVVMIVTALALAGAIMAINRLQFSN